MATCLIVLKIKIMVNKFRNQLLQQLSDKMKADALAEAAKEQAANEAAARITEMFQAKIEAGKIKELKLFLAGDYDESHPILENAKETVSEILQTNGMDEKEAQAAASKTVPKVIEGLVEKFESDAKEDQVFDLDELSKLVPDEVKESVEKIAEEKKVGTFWSKAKGLFIHEV